MGRDHYLTVCECDEIPLAINLPGVLLMIAEERGGVAEAT